MIVAAKTPGTVDALESIGDPVTIRIDHFRELAFLHNEDFALVHCEPERFHQSGGKPFVRRLTNVARCVLYEVNLPEPRADGEIAIRHPIHAGDEQLGFRW